MTTPLDLAFAVLIGIVWPLYEWRIGWPSFVRRSQRDGDRARVIEYVATIALQWTMVGVLALLLRHEGRPAAAIALAPIRGMPWIVAMIPSLAIALSTLWNARVLGRSARARTSLRARLDRFGQLGYLVPRRPIDLPLFVAVSITAGICEEILYRGFFWHALGAWMHPWLAALVACTAFGLMHAYQGRAGVLRTGIVGLVMTALVASTGSLVPAIALHALIDIQGGWASWLALQPEPAEIAPTA